MENLDSHPFFTGNLEQTAEPTAAEDWRGVRQTSRESCSESDAQSFECVLSYQQEQENPGDNIT